MEELKDLTLQLNLSQVWQSGHEFDSSPRC